jgi:outer membrane protein OmpA-like peptidoglycan-associated protein
VASEDKAKNGCPLPKDADRDGILDVEDACPNEPGVRTADPKTNGCPPPKDTDQDTIVDDVDACPEMKGKPNPDPKKHGCPEARVEQGQIRIIERVEFEYNSAKLEKASERVLQAVLELLKERADITKLAIEGHTDNKGNVWYNKNLSGRRAESVKEWIVAQGISPARLSAAGFGQERPIDSNETEAGRQNNRRVEFHMVEVDGKPVKK